jgi:alkyl sulfatase BDS1-like metallo-beta-lactamase superfamily hydrolase
LLALIVSLAASVEAIAQSQPKPATEATKAANAAVLKSLPFGNKSDFEDAERGFIARPEKLTIKNDKGDVVWDLEQYKTYIADDKSAPDSVNPSLWRNAQLNMKYGLFKVTTACIRCVATTFPISPSSKATPAGSCSIH